MMQNKNIYKSIGNATVEGRKIATKEIKITVK